MKNIIYIIVLLSFFSCKQAKEDDVEKKNVNTTDRTTIQKDSHVNSCGGGIYLDGEQIPTFNFEIEYGQKGLTFLMDTLFRSFYKAKIETGIDKSLKGNRTYIEFSKNHIYDKKDFFSEKQNIFGFYLIRETGGPLEYAELNFSTKYYRNTKRDLFKIKKDTALLDVGMDKTLFAKVFNRDAKTLCDTVYVGNETDTSYYIFRDSKLVKVIFNFYTP